MKFVCSVFLFSLSCTAFALTCPQGWVPDTTVVDTYVTGFGTGTGPVDDNSVTALNTAYGTAQTNAANELATAVAAKQQQCVHGTPNNFQFLKNPNNVKWANGPQDAVAKGYCYDGTSGAGAFYWDCSQFISKEVLCCTTIGNGVCDAGEDTNNAPEDCGAGGTCGDSICDAGEDSMSCPSDCM